MEGRVNTTVSGKSAEGGMMPATFSRGCHALELVSSTQGHKIPSKTKCDGSRNGDVKIREKVMDGEESSGADGDTQPDASAEQDQEVVEEETGEELNVEVEGDGSAGIEDVEGGEKEREKQAFTEYQHGANHHEKSSKVSTTSPLAPFMDSQDDVTYQHEDVVKSTRHKNNNHTSHPEHGCPVEILEQTLLKADETIQLLTERATRLQQMLDEGREEINAIRASYAAQLQELCGTKSALQTAQSQVINLQHHIESLQASSQNFELQMNLVLQKERASSAEDFHTMQQTIQRLTNTQAELVQKLQVANKELERSRILNKQLSTHLQTNEKQCESVSSYT